MLEYFLASTAVCPWVHCQPASMNFGTRSNFASSSNSLRVLSVDLFKPLATLYVLIASDGDYGRLRCCTSGVTALGMCGRIWTHLDSQKYGD